MTLTHALYRVCLKENFVVTEIVVFVFELLKGSVVLNSIQDKNILAMEEGHMDGCLHHNLLEKVDKLVVFETRHKELISLNAID